MDSFLSRVGPRGGWAGFLQGLQGWCALLTVGHLGKACCRVMSLIIYDAGQFLGTFRQNMHAQLMNHTQVIICIYHAMDLCPIRGYLSQLSPAPVRLWNRVYLWGNGAFLERDKFASGYELNPYKLSFQVCGLIANIHIHPVLIHWKTKFKSDSKLPVKKFA